MADQAHANRTKQGTLWEDPEEPSPAGVPAPVGAPTYNMPEGAPAPNTP